MMKIIFLKSIDRPMVPKVTSLSSDPYKITLTWDHSSLCFEQYSFSQEIQWKKNIDSKWSSYIAEPSDAGRYTITGLTAATLYDVQVRAVAMSVRSSLSEPSSLFIKVHIRTSPGTVYCNWSIIMCTLYTTVHVDVKMFYIFNFNLAYNLIKYSLSTLSNFAIFRGCIFMSALVMLCSTMTIYSDTSYIAFLRMCEIVNLYYYSLI